MEDQKDNEKRATLTLGKNSRETLSVTKNPSATNLEQKSIKASHVRNKNVTVEVKRSKSFRLNDNVTEQSKQAIESITGDANLNSNEVERKLRVLKEAQLSKQIEELHKVQEQEIVKLQEQEKLVQSAEEESAAETADHVAEIDSFEAVAASPQKAGEKSTEAAKPAETYNKYGKKSFAEDAIKEDDRPGKVGKIEDKPSKLVKDDLKKTAQKLKIYSLDENEEEERPRVHVPKRRKNRYKAPVMDKIKREVVIPDNIIIAELANRMSEKTTNVIKELMKLGVMLDGNASIDADTAELVVSSLGHKVKRVKDNFAEAGAEDKEDNIHNMIIRPPVVTVMGHVDHGKTSLLDAIRSTDIAGFEAGGITQHIGAYQIVTNKGNKITFIDTPGHEAFTAMRSRGARVTDIVILVVAADDGVMAQTIEAANHAKAANVPIIIAINKMDKPGADPGRVKNELLGQELVVEEFGGDIMAVELSAKTRFNLDKLEEMILLQAEMLDLKADPSRSARGIVIESRSDKNRGIIATLLVQKGSLRNGDIVIAGASWGKVRAIYSDKGEITKLATPSTPIEITGLDIAPEAGDIFTVVTSEKEARDIAEYRKSSSRDAFIRSNKVSSIEEFLQKSAQSKKRELSLILKADVHGSMEAIVASLGKIVNDEVTVRVIHKGVGALTESDISLAEGSRAIVLGFNVRANNAAIEQANKSKIDIKYYSIIYDLIEDINNIVSGMLKPKLREEYIGNAQIRQVFSVTKVGKIAGCYVTNGIIKRGAGVRLLRDNVVIHEGKLKTLRRFKDDVKEVREGFECGIAFENYDNILEGDVLEAYEIVK